MEPEGRRLVRRLKGGFDYQFEVAADVRRFDVQVTSNGETTVVPVDCAVVRIWPQKAQRVILWAVTENGHVLGQARAKTHKEALDVLREQIEG
jgi:hypothetical protein